MTERKYKIPQGLDGLTPAILKRMRRAEQIEFMRAWFYERYDLPEDNTPFDSEEGGYLWIWGGPYEPKEELEQEFGGVIPDKVVAEVADELEGLSFEWSGKPEYDDYDEHLYSVVLANVSPGKTFAGAAETIEALLGLTLTPELAGAQHRLLFANVIAALETYLADTFTNAALEDEERLKRFLESNPDFQKQTIRFSDVLSHAASLREKVKGYLLDVVWHNLAKVQAMYDSTFDVKFGVALAPIARAIDTRHDIVHRNGVKKDGTPVNVGETDVRGLVDAARLLVAEVEKGMAARDQF